MLGKCLYEHQHLNVTANGEGDDRKMSGCRRNGRETSGEICPLSRRVKCLTPETADGAATELTYRCAAGYALS